MGEQTSGVQSVDFQPPQPVMNTNQGLPAANLTRCDETVPRRLEWIAVILFFVSFYMTMSYSVYFYAEEVWGLFTVAVGTAASVILLLSVVFSIFGKTDLARIAIGAGIVGLMVTVVSLGIRLMQRLAEYGGFF